MATLDQISGLLKKKPKDDLDLNDVAEQDIAELAAARLAVEVNDQEAGESRLADDVDEGVGRADDSGLVSIPILGRKTPDAHQRTLLFLLGASLLILVAAAVYILNQGEKVGLFITVIEVSELELLGKN